MEVQVQRGIMQHPYDVLVKGVMRVLEANLLPDFLLRRITRTLLARSLHLGYKPNTQLQLQDLMAFINSLKRMPIALSTEKPKAQHYELPTSFFKLVLGKNLKYSSCYFASDTNTLDEAEESMLSLYCERAQIKDGQTILDIGCGWGSLTLYMAKKYPNSHVTGICNSTTQKEYIIEKSSELGMSNIVIYAGDITSFKMESTFDRIISIEMFEHMKNYGKLLKKISLWMSQESLLFIHHFCHRVFAYHFEDINEDDWMARYFFTGGTMPAASLLLFFQEHVSVIEHWLVNGKHYARTSEEWLKNMDKNMKFIYPILIDTYSVDSAKKWMVYWRTFFIAVAELFGYNDGDEWMVSHFLFKKK
ncbi:(S)-coclaurine N-methyltransferase isoform X1 [Cryptomeria japonica]|uniref:(S)-coclaurine N-methyltransferase isoform X1 n=1 Tax=Cryptomeria japonica TaxID=3369 RepID=UPI0025AC2D81|nr:(S)-coclaurine N-methyltransferase isoform X1 [Cryptomeria japonica]